MGSTSALVYSVLFGSIGFAFFIYGKKQRKTVPWLVGVALCVFPYFVTDPIAGAVIGTALTATPWLLGGSRFGRTA